MNLDLDPTGDDSMGALTSPEVYKATVRRLTSELQECRRRLADEQECRKRETGQLRAQLHEGLTPELMQLRKAVRELRSRAVAAESRLREVRRVGVTNGAR